MNEKNIFYISLLIAAIILNIINFEYPILGLIAVQISIVITYIIELKNEQKRANKLKEIEILKDLERKMKNEQER